MRIKVTVSYNERSNRLAKFKNQPYRSDRENEMHSNFCIISVRIQIMQAFWKIVLHYLIKAEHTYTL